jgi:phage anti-repressor protein
MHPLIEEDTIQSKLFPELDFTLESTKKWQTLFKLWNLKGFIVNPYYILIRHQLSFGVPKRGWERIYFLSASFRIAW